MANAIDNIFNIDAEMQRLRERRKAEVNRAFDDSVWELLKTVHGYKGSRSKSAALPTLHALIERAESEDEEATDEQENTAEEQADQEADSAPAPSPASVY